MADILQLLTQDLLTLPLPVNTLQWGIFSSNSAVIVPDSILAFAYSNDWTISTYPIEQGGFQNYDKVSNPFVVSVVLAQGGSVAVREAFLAAVDAIASSFDLYDIVTPDAIYQDMNVAHEDFRRTATEGNGLLQITLKFMEIRESAQTSFQSTQSPSGANAVSDGTVQPTNPSPTQSNDLQNFQ